MSISAATTYDLKVFGALNVGGVFFAESAAIGKAEEIVRQTPAQVVEVWKVEHKHGCGVTEIACTCKGVSRCLVHTETADPSNCPCWSGNEYGCAIHGPLAYARAHAAQEAAVTAAASRPRARLSGLAERTYESVAA